ncbi:hypothetical protein ACEPAH_2313 [Sanghuangporus vaninii]
MRSLKFLSLQNWGIYQSEVSRSARLYPPPGLKTIEFDPGAALTNTFTFFKLDGLRPQQSVARYPKQHRGCSVSSMPGAVLTSRSSPVDGVVFVFQSKQVYGFPKASLLDDFSFASQTTVASLSISSWTARPMPGIDLRNAVFPRSLEHFAIYHGK